MKAMRRVIFLSFIFCCIVSFVIPASADLVYCTVWFDLEDFSTLRTAVLNEDEAGVKSFFESGEIASDPYGEGDTWVHSPLKYGKFKLELWDQYYLLAFDQEPEGLTDRRIRAEIVGDGSLTDFWYFSGWQIEMNYFPGTDPWPDTPFYSNPDFVLKTVDGEEIKFVKHSNRNYYLAHHLLSNGKKVVISFGPSSKDMDIANPPLDKIGKISFVPFTDLTPVVGTNWLWVGIGGGAAVVIGGAVTAALIVRKKRRRAAAADFCEGVD